MNLKKKKKLGGDVGKKNDIKYLETGNTCLESLVIKKSC